MPKLKPRRKYYFSVEGETEQWYLKWLQCRINETSQAASIVSFDLWIVLHKADCNGSFIHRGQYLNPINRAYDENFESMDDYKHENNFKSILNKLTLQDVIAAVNRAKAIMQRNKENGYVLHEYKGYRYYKENPSLNIWEAIEIILKDCQLV